MIEPQDPAYGEAQIAASQLSLLLGAGFAKNRRDQRTAYIRAKQHAEQALRTDARFRERSDAGEPVWAAGNALEPAQYESLFLWATSILYLFRDVYGVPERVFKSRQLSRAREALAVMIARDPGWQDGVLLFSMGIYQLSVPKFAGGDRKEAMRLMDEAAALGVRRLLPKWGRAKYLSVALGDRSSFREDLEWVVAQDLEELDGPHLWNVYFQQDARALLKRIDQLF